MGIFDFFKKKKVVEEEIVTKPETPKTPKQESVKTFVEPEVSSEVEKVTNEKQKKSEGKYVQINLITDSNSVSINIDKNTFQALQEDFEYNISVVKKDIEYDVDFQWGMTDQYLDLKEFGLTALEQEKHYPSLDFENVDSDDYTIFLTEVEGAMPDFDGEFWSAIGDGILVYCNNSRKKIELNENDSEILQDYVDEYMGNGEDIKYAILTKKNIEKLTNIEVYLL